QTRRTLNAGMHSEDRLEIHPSDAELRGVRNGDLVSVRARRGETRLHALITERVQPGVVYTTFHHPESHTNDLMSEHSDWATNCPEYKVTAVQVAPVAAASGARAAAAGR
ncbi:MAG TPA: molybdopterin dinucleotide binding domain-containing protein, partial [Candidatus Acidoferrales bacterium]|nr:molybdopterin dinucleotide binding domain-containing protein [Candidatus Acidoferrales bacterium]